LKLYEITIQPTAGFCTALKGDTIFGHFCWQAAHDPSLLDGGLEKQLSTYCDNPFAVFSSAFPKLESSSTCYVLKRPDLPLSSLFSFKGEGRKERLLKAKEYKKRKWMALDGELRIDLSKARFLTDEELQKEISQQTTAEVKRQMRRSGPSEFMVSFSQPHNTINRLTQTTGTGPFAPYSQTSIHYFPETELGVLVLFDETATDIERIILALERIGSWGYGKDASTGMGRFGLGEHEEIPLPDTTDANACYTLGPSVPQRDSFSDLFFSTFVRFGKHGDRLARSVNPFKNPVIMADEGAVLVPKDARVFKRPYIGRGITNVSKSLPQTVVQGYAPYLPFKLGTMQ